MSYLLYDLMEPVILMDKKRVSDGAGGFVVAWVEGAEIDAAVIYNGSMQTKIAEAEGSKDTYKVAVHKSNALDNHDVIKRVSDGKTFRLTTDSDDMKTPDISSIDVRVYWAEEWELTT